MKYKNQLEKVVNNMKNSPIKSIILIALVGILILTTVVFTFKYLQLLGYWIFIANPSFLQWTLVAILIGSLRLITSDPLYKSILLIVAVGVFIIMALTIGPLFGTIYSQQDIANTNEENFVNNTDVNFPSPDPNHTRILPRDVADEHASSTLSYPRYSTGSSDPVFYNGSYHWSLPLEPDTIGETIFGNQNGAVFVNMEDSGRDIKTVEQSFDCGMGQLLTDEYDYQFRLEHLSAQQETDTAFTFYHEGELHIAQSYIEHDWRWETTPIPQFYGVPEYGGTMVMDTDCNVQDMSPEEVVESDMFTMQNTYPYDMAEYRVNSMKLKKGPLNKWFFGEDVPQIASTGSGSNSQPFTVPTEDGLEYYVITEPRGSGQGIYQLYQFDALSGELDIIEFNDTLIGPERATDLVRTENPNVNWVSGDSGTSKVIEPIPVFNDGELIWQTKVVPEDSIGITFTSFVNAQTEEVTNFYDDKQIVSFIKNGDIEGIENPANDTNDNGTSSPSDDNTVVIAIINDNGTVVDTIQVPENNTIEIKREGS